MGCAVSGPGQASKPNEEEASAATLTDHQIELIKESWKLIQEDIAKVGIIMFVRNQTLMAFQFVFMAKCFQ
ncbi:UNVERIFIED_CONTAM: hypothetical protein FKN15_049395 [Acipenser sinensis]